MTKSAEQRGLKWKPTEFSPYFPSALAVLQK